MEQQTQSNLVPVPQDSKLSKSGDDTELFKLAIQGNRVATVSEEELKTVLRYCMALVGLKGANIPQDEERDMLLNFIVNNYGKHSLAEIRLAFDMAIAGKLALKPEDVKCYENFSILYFSSIMNAYRKWAVNFHEDNRLYSDKPTLTALPSGPADWKELCELRYQDYLTGNYNMDLWPAELYDEFVKCEMMAGDVYEDFLNDANEKILADYKAIQESVDLRGNVVKQIGAALQKSFEVKAFGTGHKDVIDKAKKMAVLFLYRKAKEAGMKNLFTKV